ncbi:MAG: EAL domain-containing protein [Thiotrichales bacterium]|nr:EAL domain-containing protein [Thiotrichales bacterium]
MSDSQLPSFSVHAWQTLIDCLPCPVVLLQRNPLSPHDEQLALANQAFRQILTPNFTSMLSRRDWFAELFPNPDVRNTHEQQWQNQLSVAQANASADNAFSPPWQLPCDDGQDRWYRLCTSNHYPLRDTFRFLLLIPSEQEPPDPKRADATCAEPTAMPFQVIPQQNQKLENLLQQIQRLARVGYWELELESGQLYWSDEIYRMYGTEPGSFQPTLSYLLKTSIGKDAVRLQQALQEAIHSGKQQQLTHQIMRKDGTAATLELAGYIEYDSQGRPLKAIGSSTDITHLMNLQNQNNELVKIMELAHLEILIYSLEQQSYVYANQDALQNLGYSLEALSELPLQAINPELSHAGLIHFAQQKGKHPNRDFAVLTQLRQDGSRYPVKANHQSIRFQEQAAIVMFHTDISELKAVEQRLREQNQLFENILQTVPTRIFWQDQNGDYLGANQPFLEDLNLTDVNQLRGKNDLQIAWPSGQGENYFRQDMAVLKKGERLVQEEDAFVDSQGNIQIWQLTKLPLRDAKGRITGLLGSYQDISNHRLLEIKLREQAQVLQHQAYHDALTNLPNRSLLSERIQQAIHRAQRNGSQFAILFIDLDHFKQINDSLGHDIGDLVLRAVAKRLGDHLRKEDTISRLGGDEFTILQERLKGYEDASALAQKLINATNQPLQVEGYTFYLSNSVGISIYPKDAQTVDALLKAADAAMYRAKDKGRNNFQFYTEDLTEKAFELLSMQTQLRQALDKAAFVPFFQPQYHARSGELIGLEVLSRWPRDDGEMTLPNDFIPVAEKTGLIVALDRQVMHKAIAQFTQWKQQGYLAKAALSLNLAVKQIQQNDFSDFIKTLLSELGCHGSWLELEITESDIMTNLEEMSQKLHQLNDLGVKISIDDFGTGYSSLAYLKKLPVKKLKIDQSFIRDLPDDEEDAIITRTIISMAENLGLEVIAEGVETAAQRDFLLANGCELMQGYFYSKPLPAAQFTELLNSREPSK